MPIATGRATESFGAEAIRSVVVGLNHQTSAFVMCASSALEPGGTRPIAMRCWRCAAPSITARSIGYSSGIGGAYEKRKNHRMLLLGTISQHAEASVGTIKRRLHVARQRLRQELAWVAGS